MTAERTFTITFVPRGDIDGVKAVKRLLKYAGRYLGLRAIHAQEHSQSTAEPITHVPATARGAGHGV
jgi:hypothetical protein